MAVLIGTSGWQYRDWRGRFYPREVPQKAWLEHYAERFVTVEVNNAFYRLPEARVFAAWAERTPDDFIVAVKVSRYLTHIKRLRDAADRSPVSSTGPATSARSSVRCCSNCRRTCRPTCRRWPTCSIAFPPIGG